MAFLIEESETTVNLSAVPPSFGGTKSKDVARAMVQCTVFDSHGDGAEEVAQTNDEGQSRDAGKTLHLEPSISIFSRT